jgi:hypothetical protein
VNRDELDKRHAAAVARYARNLADTGGRAPRALLDELAGIAGEHRLGDVTGYRTADGKIYHPADVEIIRHGDAGSTETPPRVAADGTNAVTGGIGSHVNPPSTGGSSSARTRTRTRGGPK